MQAEHDPGLSPGQRQLAARLRAELEQGSALDAVTAARLTAARHRALAAVAPRRHAPLWAAALAAGVIGALALGLQFRQGADPAPGADDSMDLLVYEEEGPEFYQDLELYEWLDHEMRAG
jgi:hypothetical protein